MVVMMEAWGSRMEEEKTDKPKKEREKKERMQEPFRWQHIPRDPF
jgi:hypothetical protein